ncbi:MAG: T9SS type A sorting domain-containing protein [Rhodothermaceae bacterium]|nr:T9SS type A sorting domain-containing protein [Rhodothermaceae bacterium]
MWKRALFHLALIGGLCAPPVLAQSDWVQIAPMPTPRTAAAVAVLNGQIYVMGGRDAAGMALGVVERYNPTADQWTTVGSLDKPRFNAAAAVLSGQILLIGGRAFDDDDDELEVTEDVEVYDLSRDRWESFDDLEGEREGLAAFAVSGFVYAFGGTDSLQTFLSDAEVYDESVGDWVDYPFWELSVPRAAFAAVPEGDGVLIFGGFSTFGPLADVEHYIPGDPSDIPRAPLPESRGGLAGAGVNDLIYAIGGRNAAGVVVDRVDVYNPAQDLWSPGAALPEPREAAVAAAVDTVLYVFGGNTDSGALATTSLALMTTTAVEPGAPSAQGLALELAGPNPFRAVTALTLTLERPRTVTVAVYDALGRQVAMLHQGPLAAGGHRLDWDGSGEAQHVLPSGLYLVRAQAGSTHAVQRLTRLR